MTLNEEIQEFVGKLVTWSTNAAVRLAELDDKGLTSSKEAQKILKDSKDVMELADALYVTDIQLVDDDKETKLNYLTDSDSDIRQLMSDWEYYLKLNTLGVGTLPLDGKYYMVQTSTSSGSITWPSGGTTGDLLIRDASGNGAWTSRPTLFEVPETT